MIFVSLETLNNLENAWRTFSFGKELEACLRKNHTQGRSQNGMGKAFFLRENVKKMRFSEALKPLIALKIRG